MPDLEKSKGSTPEQRAEWAKLEGAAHRGPWWWGGNTDHHGDVALHGASIGYGVMDVMRPTMETLSEEELRAEFRADSELSDYCTEDEYVDSREAERRSYLAFLLPDKTFVKPGRDLAIYEVARNQGLPDDTPRTHPKIYRADVVGIRNPNAEFIAEARTAVPALLEDVRVRDERIAAALELHPNTRYPWFTEDGTREHSIGCPRCHTDGPCPTHKALSGGDPDAQ